MKAMGPLTRFAWSCGTSSLHRPLSQGPHTQSTCSGVSREMYECQTLNGFLPSTGKGDQGQVPCCLFSGPFPFHSSSIHCGWPVQKGKRCCQQKWKKKVVSLVSAIPTSIGLKVLSSAPLANLGGGPPASCLLVFLPVVAWILDSPTGDDNKEQEEDDW